MARGTRRYWWSIGFAAGFIIRDLMEDESSVRTGLRKLYEDCKTCLIELMQPPSDQSTDEGD